MSLPKIHICSSCFGSTTEPSTHAFQDRDSVSSNPNGVQDVVAQDGVEQIVLVLRLEWGLTRHHLVQQDPKRPPVHTGPVVKFLQDLQKVTASREVIRHPLRPRSRYVRAHR